MSARFGLICAAVIVTLSGSAGPAAAQNPAIQANCAVQSVNMPPAPVTWQIKGSGSVINLPAGTTVVNLAIKFEKKANGAANWVQMFTANQALTPVAGTAAYDTGFQTFMAAPAQGDQYRIMVGGTYVTNMMMIFNLPNTGSLSVTPVP